MPCEYVHICKLNLYYLSLGNIKEKTPDMSISFLEQNTPTARKKYSELRIVLTKRIIYLKELFI